MPEKVGTMPKIKQKLQQAPNLRTSMPMTKMGSELGAPYPPRALTHWVAAACAFLFCAVFSSTAFGEAGVVSPCKAWAVKPGASLTPLSYISISGGSVPVEPYAQPLTLFVVAYGVPSPASLSAWTLTRLSGQGNKIDITVEGEPGKLGELLAMLDEIPADVPIVEPVQARP